MYLWMSQFRVCIAEWCVKGHVLLDSLPSDVVANCPHDEERCFAHISHGLSSQQRSRSRGSDIVRRVQYNSFLWKRIGIEERQT